MKKLWKSITDSFEALYVWLGISREINEDGSWDIYWAKQSMKAELKVLKFNYKEDKKSIKNKWMKSFKKGR